MTESFTLAHLSDLHLTPLAGFHPRYWNVKRGLGYLNWRRNRRHVHRLEVADRLAADAKAHAGHIVVTGDLAHLGLPAELDAALGWLGRLGPPERVTAVPGNHDIYSARMHGASALSTWSAYMAPCAWGGGIAGGADASGMFPFVRRAGPLALIGVNSALPRAPFVAAGRVGGAQLERLSFVLDALAGSGLVRVVLLHHPPLPGQAPRLRGLDDAAELALRLRRHGAELVLHGHNHTDMLAWIERGGGRVPVAGVASGSAGRAHKGEPLARYKLFRIEGGPGRAHIEMVTRGLEEPEGAIVELDRRIL